MPAAYITTDDGSTRRFLICVLGGMPSLSSCVTADIRCLLFLFDFLQRGVGVRQSWSRAFEHCGLLPFSIIFTRLGFW